MTTPNTPANDGQILTDERIDEIIGKWSRTSSTLLQLCRAVEDVLMSVQQHELWARIYHLEEAVKGPDGFATWQEAATAERVRRVKAEADLRASLAAPAIQTVDRNAVPSGDALRAIVRSASTSPSDGASPQEYVLAGWNAALKSAPASVPMMPINLTWDDKVGGYISQPLTLAAAPSHKAQPAAQVAVPVEYQFRTRADWHKNWSEWEKCSEGSYCDYIKAPCLHDWHYEVRALGVLATPATDKTAEGL